MQTKSKNGVFKPNVFFATKYALSSTHLSHLAVSTPTCYSQASKVPVWQKIMKNKYTALKDANSWTYVPPYPSQNLIGYKWVFKIKYNADGSIERHKPECLDYTGTYSPVVKPSTIKVVLSLAVKFEWQLRQLYIIIPFFMGI